MDDQTKRVCLLLSALISLSVYKRVIVLFNHLENPKSLADPFCLIYQMEIKTEACVGPICLLVHSAPRRNGEREGFVVQSKLSSLFSYVCFTSRKHSRRNASTSHICSQKEQMWYLNLSLIKKGKKPCILSNT
jgi:hypothetical protein